MKLATIIITVYNDPDFLRQAIESALAQDYPACEIIVMDDKSKDKLVADVLMSYGERIKWYNTHVREDERLKTARYATNINTAVRQYSKGDYIFYLPHDDWYYPKKVSESIRVAEAGGFHVVYSPQDQADESGRITGKRGNLGILKTAFNILDHGQVMNTRIAFDKAGGWNDHQDHWGGADAYFWNRLSEAGYKFNPTGDEPLCVKRHREHGIQWNLGKGLKPDQK